MVLAGAPVQSEHPQAVSREGGIGDDPQKQTVRKPAPFQDIDKIVVRSLLNGSEEMSGKGSAFGHTTVYPGSEIGYHFRSGDSETC